jgi:hypothetical protein
VKRRRLSPTARATRDRWAPVLEAEAIVAAAWERDERQLAEARARIKARMAAIRKEIGR